MPVSIDELLEAKLQQVCSLGQRRGCNLLCGILQLFPKFLQFVIPHIVIGEQVDGAKPARGRFESGPSNKHEKAPQTSTARKYQAASHSSAQPRTLPIKVSFRSLPFF